MVDGPSNRITLGVLNSHLRSEPNRCYLYGIVEELKVDICVLTETWFEDGTSETLMSKIFGDDFVWFGSERKEQKKKSGSGGLGILARKNIGNFSLVKEMQ